MTWNLVDAFEREDSRRPFAMPIAVDNLHPDGGDIERGQYSFSESYTTDDPANPTRTTDSELSVTVTPRSGGFTDVDGLPDPSLRLFAVSAGTITFEPADGAMGDRLVHEMHTFSLSELSREIGLEDDFPAWWDRWVEADCIPTTVIYEDVDVASVEAALHAVDAPVDDKPENEVEPTRGLSFPVGVTTQSKSQFITEFMNGTDGRVMLAQPGAYLGIPTSSDPTDPDADRSLGLHARYMDHEPGNEQPMNPRELFALLFGIDSREAANHPVLAALETRGSNNPDGRDPETKRMRLRPPLRTWRRVVWESNLEVTTHSGSWASNSNIGADRFYNDHERDGGEFNDTYGTGFKCNLFVSDIVIRAGFRACMHQLANDDWHYIDANSFTNHSEDAFDPNDDSDRLPVHGAGDDADRVWAWNIENWLRSIDAADRQATVNEAMTEEGRCILLAAAKPRRFRDLDLPTGVDGVANCTDSLRPRGVGHVVILDEVLNQPQLEADEGDGLHNVRVNSYQAANDGAVEREYEVTIQANAGSADGVYDFIRLQLLELHPGRDPDTLQGLGDLLVENLNLNLLGTDSEQAPNEQLTHNPDGTVRTDNQCCHDEYPPGGNNPTEETC